MDRRAALVALADGWGPIGGGVNAFNFDLCKGIAKAWGNKGRVICAVTGDLREEDVASAKLQFNIELRPIKRVIRKSAAAMQDVLRFSEVEEKLRELWDDCKVDDLYWLGHDVFTGFAALEAAKELGGKSAVLRHMERFVFSGRKGHSGKDVLKKDHMQACVLKGANFAFAVGPKLYQGALRHRSDVIQLIPGLVSMEYQGPNPQEDIHKSRDFRGFAAGRLNAKDDVIKQSGLAVSGFAAAINEICKYYQISEFSFLCIGLSEIHSASASEEMQLLELINQQTKRSVNLVASPFTTDREIYFQNLRGCDVCYMLSTHEGFGLVGWEAIALGVPLILSKKSGLYEYLKSQNLDRRVYEVDVDHGILPDAKHAPRAKEEIELVKAATLRVASDLKVAKRHAELLRKELSDLNLTWESTGAALLKGIGALPSLKNPRSKGQTGGVRMGRTNVRQSVPQDPKADFLGPDIERGTTALEVVTQRGHEAVPELIEWLKAWESSPWSHKTHNRQVQHRFKTFFAAFPSESAPRLVDLILSSEGALTSVAACFDLIRDENIRMQSANSIGSALNKMDGYLELSGPGRVRGALLSLGYLGALNWVHEISRILREASSDTDEKFRSYALQSVALMIAKSKDNDLSGVHYLDLLLSRFNTGQFSPHPHRVTKAELTAYVKPHLRRRKHRFDVGGLVGILNSSARLWTHPEGEPEYLVCVTHLIGEANVTGATPALSAILLDPAAPIDVREEAARALGRITSSTAVDKLAQAIEKLASAQSSGVNEKSELLLVAVTALFHVVHFGEIPLDSLKLAFKHSNIKEPRRPLTIRAVGLCRASQFESVLRKTLSENPNADCRGQAGLALARIDNSKYRNLISKTLDEATTPQEIILLSLAAFLSGAKPDTRRVRESLNQDFFDFPNFVSDDVVSILSGADAKYRNLIKPWKSVWENEPENLRYLG